MLGIKSTYWEKPRIEAVNNALEFLGSLVERQGTCENKEEYDELYVISMREILNDNGITDWVNNTYLLELAHEDSKAISEIAFHKFKKNVRNKTFETEVIIRDINDDVIPSHKLSVDGVYEMLNYLEGLLWSEESIRRFYTDFRLSGEYEQNVPEDLKKLLSKR